MLAALGAGAAGYFVQSNPLAYAALQQAACPWNLLTDLSLAWFGAGILFFCGLAEYLISRMISSAIKRLRYGF